MHVRRTRLALLAALAMAAGACAGAEHPAAPGEAHYDEQPAPPPTGQNTGPQDDPPPADTTGERWGGFIGGGG